MGNNSLCIIRLMCPVYKTANINVTTIEFKRSSVLHIKRCTSLIVYITAEAPTRGGQINSRKYLKGSATDIN